MARVLVLAAVVVLAACGSAPPEDVAAPEMELVESWPVETSLDDPTIRDTREVWVEMIDRARTTLDFAQFYGASRPGSALEDVIAAIERAADRGVRVRFLFDVVFHDTMPEVPARLRAMDGVEVRLADFRRLGGVHHAKYFIVDEREAFLGSQNFDWRSLEHIAELGVRMRQTVGVSGLRRVFEWDWALAGGDEPPREPPPSYIGENCFDFVVYGNGSVDPDFLASPRDHLPDRVSWDLPVVLDLIDHARRVLRLEFLDYSVVDSTRWGFSDLDRALIAAADRGVEVEMILSDWVKEAARIGHIQELERHPKISIRLVTIPESSAGFEPYSRVVHRKFLVADGEHSWIGTSNAGGEYFFASRNVGLVVHGETFAADLDRLFEALWSSPYAYPVDPDATYAEPRFRK